MGLLWTAWRPSCEVSVDARTPAQEARSCRRLSYARLGGRVCTKRKSSFLFVPQVLPRELLQMHLSVRFVLCAAFLISRGFSSCGGAVFWGLEQGTGRDEVWILWRAHHCCAELPVGLFHGEDRSQVYPLVRTLRPLAGPCQEPFRQLRASRATFSF